MIVVAKKGMFFFLGGAWYVPNEVVVNYFANNVRSMHVSRQFIATSAEVTPKGSLVRESYPTWP